MPILVGILGIPNLCMLPMLSYESNAHLGVYHLGGHFLVMSIENIPS